MINKNEARVSDPQQKKDMMEQGVDDNNIGEKKDNNHNKDTGTPRKLNRQKSLRMAQFRDSKRARQITIQNEWNDAMPDFYNSFDIE